jgi:hypothetical protein
VRVLVGCECSGRVRDAFARRGWEAWSADLLPSEIPARVTVTDYDKSITDLDGLFGANHYQGDVRDLFSREHPVNAARRTGNLWDLAIMHPPCTELSLAGARWWPAKRADGRQDAAAQFFMEMVNAPAPLVAVENPRGDMKRRYRPPDQEVEPWWFGDPFAKKTCLWLKGLPELTPSHTEADFPQLFRATTGGGNWRTDKAAGRQAMSAYEDSEGRANRAKVRSRTFPGFAQAMAAQWGSFAEAVNDER